MDRRRSGRLRRRALMLALTGLMIAATALLFGAESGAASGHPVISGYKFNDRNENGRWDAGEFPSGNWRIDLWRDGVLMGSAVTNASGYYEFIIDPSLGRQPGLYTLTETLKTGWKQTAAPSPVLVPADVEVKYEHNDFGNFLLGGISGFKWVDANGDGVRDANEPRSANWSIELLKDGVVVKTTKTGPSGWYSFAGLDYGDYQVRAVEGSGEYRTYPADPGFYSYSIVSGSAYCEADFGGAPYSTVKPLKVNDLDADGERDALEPLLSGWPMHLGDLAKNELRAPLLTTDDTSTSPAWLQMRKGDYMVWEDAREGWTPVGSPEQLVSLVPGQDVTVTFYNTGSAAIEGTKFHDHDRDGVMEAGDEPVAGWAITLVDPDGKQTTAVTGDDGRYAFRGLRPDVPYAVQEETRDWWRPTTAPSALVTAKAGETVGVDFGNVHVGDLVGRKYQDVDGDGELDAGEPGVAGVEIMLFGADGIQVGSPVQTDAEGRYTFDGLTPGAYKVVETVPTGWKATSEQAMPATVEAGGVSEGPVFLNAKLASVSGVKFDDSDMSGTRGAGEGPVPGFEIILEKQTASGEWSPVGTSMTGENGEYRFDGLTPGVYRVRETQQTGWTPTVVPTELKIAGEDVTGVDFGNVRLSSLTLYKWDDSDSDGIRDAAEAPLADWSFHLTGASLDGRPLDRWVTTDAEGKVVLDAILPGTYTADEQRVGLALNPDGTVSEPGWRPTTSPSAALDVKEGSNESTSFGNIHLGWVWGRVTQEVYGTPIAGIKLVLEETGEVAYTNSDGYYFFYTEEPNGTVVCPTVDYLVSIDLSGTSWMTSGPVDKPVVVLEGQGARADFTVYTYSSANQPRTIGYWKNWANHYTAAEMQGFVDTIRLGSAEFSDLTVDQVFRIVQVDRKTSVEGKARAQYLAFWLNVASGNLGLGTRLDVSSVAGWQTVVSSADAEGHTDVAGLLHDMEATFVNEWLPATWEVIKNVLDALNNALLS